MALASRPEGLVARPLSELPSSYGLGCALAPGTGSLLFQITRACFHWPAIRR
jgi:hypothetical protein